MLGEATHLAMSLTAAAEMLQVLAQAALSELQVLAWAARSQRAPPRESPGQSSQKCPGALHVQHISIRGCQLIVGCMQPLTLTCDEPLATAVSTMCSAKLAGIHITRETLKKSSKRMRPSYCRKVYTH